MLLAGFAALLVFAFTSLSQRVGLLLKGAESKKIKGVCMVAPARPIQPDQYDPVVSINAEWVAIIPYAFCNPDNPKLVFDHPGQWWGERSEGVVTSILYAQKKGLKIMLKPHIWVRGQGWAGDLEFADDTGLKIWQNSYREYLFNYAKIADSLGVEMLAIGTELRKLTSQDPDYWNQLIKEIRNVYHGKITYCANWDNYQNITFWSQLDYVGIDAYFPVHEAHTPTVDELSNSFSKLAFKLKLFYKKHNKQILFTEYGFRSMDYCTAGHWDQEYRNVAVNLVGQANAFDALFQSIWHQSWFAGGFIWKWHYNHSMAGGKDDSHFTPQNKPAEEILSKYFSSK